MKNFFLVAVLILPLSANSTYAEFNCISDVTFKWRSSAAELSKDGQQAKDIEESWANLSVVGATEESAKNALKPLIEKSRSEAAIACRQQHENLSGCMAARYVSMGGAYSNLGFTARKNMDEAIKSDCEKLQGKCLGVFSTEAECKDLNPPSELETEEGSEGVGAGGTAEKGSKQEKGKK